MRKTLSELMSETAGNRISDPIEVGKLVTELAYITLGELSREMTEWGEGLLRYMGLPDRDAYTLRFGELLNMIRIVCCNDKVSDYAARLKLSFIELSEGSAYVKLFKAVTLGAFTDFIDQKSGTLRGSSVYNRISSIGVYDLSIRAARDMTLGELFKEFGAITRWNIGCSLKRFAERTSACCLIIKLLMVDCFRFAFPDLFSFSELENRFNGYDDDLCEYDRIDSFGDAYDTDADRFLIKKGEKNYCFTLSKSEQDEWDAVTSKLRRLGERQKMAEEWNAARSGLLARIKDKKAV